MKLQWRTKAADAVVNDGEQSYNVEQSGQRRRMKAMEEVAISNEQRYYNSRQSYSGGRGLGFRRALAADEQ